MQKVIILDADSLVVRAYARSWDARAENATLCRMFWGLLFLPFAWLVVRPLDAFFNWLADRVDNYKRARWSRKALEEVDDRPPRRPLTARFLNWLEEVFLIGSLRYVVFSLAGLLLLGVVAVLVWLVATHVLVILKGLAMLAGVIVLAIILTAPVIWAMENGKLSWLADILDALGGFFKTLWKVLYHGGKAVKTRTCPKIEVR